jgi:hypothetical protein
MSVYKAKECFDTLRYILKHIRWFLLYVLHILWLVRPIVLGLLSLYSRTPSVSTKSHNVFLLRQIPK